MVEPLSSTGNVEEPFMRFFVRCQPGRAAVGELMISSVVGTVYGGNYVAFALRIVWENPLEADLPQAQCSERKPVPRIRGPLIKAAFVDASLPPI